MKDITSRIVEFDYIRVISITGILVCHSCFLFSYPATDIGRYFALTFNFLFLALSAFLFGMSWDSKGSPRYSISFVKQRLSKLTRSYYPYLAILFLFLYFTEEYFSWRKIISHVIYLSWFDKIDGFGHLWFLTMIAICYVGCWLFSKLSRSVFDNALLICIYGGVIYLDYIVSRFGLPGYIFPYLAAYIWIFANANRVLRGIRRITLTVNLIQFLVVNAVVLLIFVNGIFQSAPFCAYLLGMLSACSVFAFTYDVLRNFSSNNVITWLSGISFEVYLVHEFFIGRFNIYDNTPDPVTGFSALVVLSVLGGYAVHQLSVWINKLTSFYKV